MVSGVVNEICIWAKKHVVGLSFSLPTIGFELGQSKKSLLLIDDLGDWESKFARAKEKCQVRRHLTVCDSLLNWFLPDKNRHKNSGTSGYGRSYGTFASGCLLLIKDAP
jgi:hypothetical protein